MLRMASAAHLRRSDRHSASATSVRTASVVTSGPDTFLADSRALACDASPGLMRASQYTVSTKIAWLRACPARVGVMPFSEIRGEVGRGARRHGLAKAGQRRNWKQHDWAQLDD